MNLGEVHQREYGRMLASLIRVVRDFTLAEEALQEAFEAALVQWPVSGEPEKPVAWLMSTARHKAIDQLRRRVLAEQKRDEVAAAQHGDGAGGAEPEDTPVPLDSLRLIFTCCHPALAPEAQIALSLRTICGLSTEEIARAFVVPVATLAQRLVRAKAKIKLAGIPYEVPSDDALPARLEAVLTVIYLVFNEGYSASFGADHVRADLCNEAIRLGRNLSEQLPREAEAKALLALMLFHDARRMTRTDEDGAIVLLEDQDRSRWDRAKIEEGTRLVEDALQQRPTGPYAVQAAIAALHAQAPQASATDWAQIAALYGVLVLLRPSPVVELNRAVAIAMSAGLAEGLALLERVELPGYHLLPAARAEILRRLGRLPEAVSCYREALELVTSDAERTFLKRRLDEVSHAGP